MWQDKPINLAVASHPIFWAKTTQSHPRLLQSFAPRKSANKKIPLRPRFSGGGLHMTSHSYTLSWHSRDEQGVPFMSQYVLIELELPTAKKNRGRSGIFDLDFSRDKTRPEYGQWGSPDLAVAGCAGVGLLVGWGIRHRYGGPVDELDRPSFPAPVAWDTVTE